MIRIEQGLRPPTLANAGTEGAGAGLPADILAARLDDVTTAYVLKTRMPFDLLRQASGQLAGLLVLAASGGRSAQHHPMLGLAEGCLAEAVDLLRGTSPPPRAVHHHFHLTQAARAIGRAMEAARERLHRRDDESMDAIIGPLRAGFHQLQFAAGALPGFEIVAFEQGCCGSHPAVQRLGETGFSNQNVQPVNIREK